MYLACFPFSSCAPVCATLRLKVELWAHSGTAAGRVCQCVSVPPYSGGHGIF
jgi:hypothetical protein